MVIKVDNRIPGKGWKKQCLVIFKSLKDTGLVDSKTGSDQPKILLTNEIFTIVICQLTVKMPAVVS